VAAFLGVSRSQLYDDVAQGRPLSFPVVRVGRKLRVPTAPLLALFDPNNIAAAGDEPAAATEDETLPTRKENLDGNTRPLRVAH
jgi:hypothetical protein